MPIDLSNVVWAASNIPAGLSFNTKTGVFTGTPTEAGEYTVPVSVDNGYGTDTKDVSIVVTKSYSNNFSFYIPSKIDAVGEIVRIDLHDYFSTLGDDEKISLKDDGVTECEYEFLYSSGSPLEGTPDTEQLIELAASATKGHCDYDVNTGEIILERYSDNWSFGQVSKCLRIKTNLSLLLLSLAFPTLSTDKKIYDKKTRTYTKVK